MSSPAEHLPPLSTQDVWPQQEGLSASAGRVPGSRGRATRQRLLESTAKLLGNTSWRSIKVIDIAREAGTSPATFYQYFENVEQASLVLAEELFQGAERVARLVDGDWSENGSWTTARQVVEAFSEYWEANRAIFRVVELATEEGDLRFHAQRVRALNAVTVALARTISASNKSINDTHADPMALAATLISMLAHVAAHRYGFEFWGIRTASMTDGQARILHWTVTGRPPSLESRDDNVLEPSTETADGYSFATDEPVSRDNLDCSNTFPGSTVRNRPKRTRKGGYPLRREQA
jgi:AcrR family transcriptional regulator